MERETRSRMRKAAAAIAAGRSNARAAKFAGVSVRTLQRWKGEPEWDAMVEGGGRMRTTVGTGDAMSFAPKPEELDIDVPDAEQSEAWILCTGEGDDERCEVVGSRLDSGIQEDDGVVLHFIDDPAKADRVRDSLRGRGAMSREYERIITGNDARFLCPFCPQLFPTEPPLRRHIEMHHGGRPKPPSKIRRVLRRH